MRRLHAGHVALALVLATTALAADAPAGNTIIVQKDKAFSRHTLSIRAGDTVTFVNADTVTHNVYSVTRGCEFELRTQAPGGSSAVPFDRPCSAHVRCAIHPKMKLRVDVGQ